MIGITVQGVVKTIILEVNHLFEEEYDVVDVEGLKIYGENTTEKSVVFLMLFIEVKFNGIAKEVAVFDEGF